MATPKNIPAKYVMRISRMTVDKLGVKLYDRVSAVLAELVSNCYDADGQTVTITAPMDEFLAAKSAGQLKDKGFTITVEDDGIGMTPDEVNRFYLRVGAERRNESARGRGDVSPKFKRKVMGRKGVGKLAPFGICQKMEVITAGGENVVEGKNEQGQKAKGYLTAHLILDRDAINRDEDFDYTPEIGSLDGTVRAATGTKIILRVFAYRSVPAIDELARQLAQRFGIESKNWKIVLKDSSKTAGAANSKLTVGAFDLDVMDGTKIEFKAAKKSKGPLPAAVMPDGTDHPTIKAGFESEGKSYPLTGWIAYAKKAYKDELMVGVRIYCRGKIAAQTHAFEHKSGFEGEFSVRSYLIGELHADWLDTEEDLIQTDRRDILWSDELGTSFQNWGREVVGEIGKITRNPMRKKILEQFQENSGIKAKAQKIYPGKDNQQLREKSVEIAEMFGKSMREAEVNDPDVVDNVVQLSLMLAPHITLDEKLKEAASTQDGTFKALASILRTAKVAELAAYGQIARDRVRVIGRLEALMKADKTDEDEFQNLLEEAPWLVHAEWHPVTNNQGFKLIKEKFEEMVTKSTGKKSKLTDFEKIGKKTKRPDFVLLPVENSIQLVEIKKKKHKLANDEMDRIENYYELMRKFLSAPGNQEFLALYPDFKITLVCDGTNLSGVWKKSFESYQKEGKLEHISWNGFLLRTRKANEKFLEEAERQKKLAINET